MSRIMFDDNCPGCRPAMLNPQTGEILKPDSPEMQVINDVWAHTTFRERLAFHRVCCLNSRMTYELIIVRDLSKRMADAIRLRIGSAA